LEELEELAVGVVLVELARLDGLDHPTREAGGLLWRDAQGRLVRLGEHRRELLGVADVAGRAGAVGVLDDGALVAAIAVAVLGADARDVADLDVALGDGAVEG